MAAFITNYEEAQKRKRKKKLRIARVEKGNEAHVYRIIDSVSNSIPLTCGIMWK